jgi:hypothetical protein
MLSAGYRKLQLKDSVILSQEKVLLERMSAKRVEDTGDITEVNIGVRGFEPPTT